MTSPGVPIALPNHTAGRRCAGILLGAGSGSRLGAGVPKAFVRVAGRTVLERAAAGMLAATEWSELVVVVPRGWEEEAARLLPGTGTPVRMVTGGASRLESVAAASRLLDFGDPPDTVVVHDAARCLTRPEQFRSVAVRLGEGARFVVTATPSHDLHAQVDGPVLKAVEPAAGCWGMQTPAGYRWRLFQELRTHDDPRLDTQRALGNGIEVAVVPGAPWGHKLTVPADLPFLEALAGGQDG